MGLFHRRKKWSYFKVPGVSFEGWTIRAKFWHKEPSVARTTCPRRRQILWTATGFWWNHHELDKPIVGKLCHLHVDGLTCFCFWKGEETTFLGSAFKYVFQIQLFFQEMTDIFQMDWSHDLVLNDTLKVLNYVEILKADCPDPTFLEIPLNGKFVWVSWKSWNIDVQTRNGWENHRDRSLTKNTFETPIHQRRVPKMKVLGHIIRMI